MTCIAGIVCDGNVWIGGDSAATNSLSQQFIDQNKKVFFVKNQHGDEFLLGCTTSYRMIDLLTYWIQPPKYLGGDVHQYMVTEFIEIVRECFKEKGFAKKEEEREEGGDFLVGFRGRLFRVWSSYQVSEAKCQYCTAGSAADIAHGSLHSTQGLFGPEERLRMALVASAYHNCDVREPFFIKCLSSVEDNYGQR